MRADTVLGEIHRLEVRVVTARCLCLLAVAMALSGCGGCGKSSSPASGSYAFDDFHAGVALMDQHSFLKAAERFEKVLATAPDWYAAMFNCGLAYLNSQTEYDKARARLEAAVRLRPD